MRWIASAIVLGWLALTATPEAASAAEAVAGATALRSAVQQQQSLRVIARLRAPMASANALLQGVEQMLRGRMTGIGVSRFDRLGDLPFVALEVDAQQLDALVASGMVEAVHPDRLLRPTLAESVPLIDAPAAWKQGARGDGQAVAILDTGVDATHPFLKGKLLAEACYSSTVKADSSTSFCRKGAASQTGKGAGAPCPNLANDCLHGTHVAGIAVGKGSKFSGVAPNAKLISVQVFSRVADAKRCDGLSPCVLAYESDIINGLNYVRSQASRYKIAAANLSLSGLVYGNSCDGEPIKAAIDALRAKGIATVVAAGNDGDAGGVGYPGCVSSAITVASSTGGQPEAVSSFSDMAPMVDFLAPGESITSSVPGGGFATLSGTSMAAPLVAGAWAVLKSSNANLTVSRVEQAFASTGRLLKDKRSGLTRPRIDVAKALTATRAKTKRAAPAPTS